MKRDPGNRAGDVPAAIVAAGADAVRAWLAFVADPARTPGTRRVYRLHIGRFLRWAEGRGRTLQTLTAADWDAFAAALTPAAAGDIRSPVAMLFARLADAGVVPANPFPRGRPGRRPAAAPALPLAELKRAVRELDPTWEEDSGFFRAGMVVLAPAAIDTMDPAAIAAYTGLPEPEVREYAGRLLANRRWSPDGTVALDPDDPDSWGATLIVHVLVAVGHVECRPEGRGDVLARPAAAAAPAGGKEGPSDAV